MSQSGAYGRDLYSNATTTGNAVQHLQLPSSNDASNGCYTANSSMMHLHSYAVHTHGLTSHMAQDGVAPDQQGHGHALLSPEVASTWHGSVAQDDIMHAMANLHGGMPHAGMDGPYRNQSFSDHAAAMFRRSQYAAARAWDIPNTMSYDSVMSMHQRTRMQSLHRMSAHYGSSSNMQAHMEQQHGQGSCHMMYPPMPSSNSVMSHGGVMPSQAHKTSSGHGNAYPGSGAMAALHGDGVAHNRRCVPVPPPKAAAYGLGHNMKTW